jgi:UDP-GlcNAc:undecaprenyl-phosphate GlcNAc-1-phosphate transferase
MFSYISLTLLFFSATGLTFLFALAVKALANKFRITDKPDLEKKLHERETPLLGGVAIFLAYFILLFFIRQYLVSGDLNYHHWIGVFLGASVLMIGGILDDKFNLKPGRQIIFPLLAAILVVAGGVGIEKVSNPFGGLIHLSDIKFPMIFFGGFWHYFVLIADSFTIIWLMGMMYTTKLLDAVDGLVTGVTSIGALIIFLFTMTTKYFQPDIGIAALLLSGSCLGFLILNWHPAKIFLGESGSLFTGYILGVLAIISGGKIAIALLILGIPILDVLWTITRRLISGKNPFRFSDRMHLHHRILNLGIGPKKTVLIYYGFSAIFGISALFLQSKGKLLVLMMLIIMMVLIVSSFSWSPLKSNKKKL